MSKRILITGGAGFIGINCVHHYLREGFKVFVFDNLSKEGSKDNIDEIGSSERIWETENFYFIDGDLIRKADVDRTVSNIKPDIILHLGAQTAVTTSINKPIYDFACNAAGTLYLLEAVRKHCPDALVIYNSTNKVYGSLEDVDAGSIARNGIHEGQNLDFHSPYGNSKGAADQYVNDYRRIYGLNTVVPRCSCVYGPYQTGSEDQGWVAWFIRCFLEDRPLTIYGDGSQVRDLLYITDLIKAYDQMIYLPKANGIYNFGGGINNQISLLQLISKLSKRFNKGINLSFEEKRPGDQQIFVSNNLKAQIELYWTPSMFINTGLTKLIDYLERKFC